MKSTSSKHAGLEVVARGAAAERAERALLCFVHIPYYVSSGLTVVARQGFPRLSFYVPIVVHFTLETSKCIGIHKALLGVGDIQDSATRWHVDCHRKYFFKATASRHVPEYDKLGGLYDNPKRFFG